MKDEVKEILGEIYNIQLGYMKPVYKRDYSNKDYVIESYENLVFRMKNCITNLQEENNIAQKDIEALKDNYNDLVKKGGNKISNLQEEYEKEQYLVDKLTRQLNDEYKNTEYQCKQKEVYKSRCEKAINKLQTMFDNGNEQTILNDLLELDDILEGGE